VPELPEVELLRRSLDASLPGMRIHGVEVRLPKAFRADPDLTVDDLVGQVFVSVGRRAKYLILDLSGGLCLTFHLRLSGQLVLRRGEATLVAGGHPVPRFDAPLPHKSTHLVLDLVAAADRDFTSPSTRLFYTDIRQFGFCHLMPSARLAEYLDGQSLGPDAIAESLTQDAFSAIVRARPRARLKSLLLDQTAVAGLGNIYADEALFLARLHPLRRAGSLEPREISSLLDGIRGALNYALENGVAHVLNGRADPDGRFPRVHGREGQACPECASCIIRIRIGGRSTYYCPQCQGHG
jgi:formamidopyrimidine-DNA glycosylase